jgi:LPS-assembly protein
MTSKASFKIMGSFVIASTILVAGVVLAKSQERPKVFKPTHQAVAQALVWQPGISTKGSICQGAYYFDPAISAVPNPPKMNEAATTITSKGTSILMPDGRSVLNKDVVFSQRGRKITADKAYIYRNNHTGKITRIKLFGHVHDLTADNLIVAPYALVDMQSHQVYFKHAIVRHHYPSHLDGVQTSWGTATKVHKEANGDTEMQHHLQLSLCSPLKPSWVIHGSEGHIDKAKHKLKVHNAYITFHHVPLFYSPILTISTSNKRKSGLLRPKVGYSSNNGFQLALPYYFNIAPNADDLLQNGWYSKRGYIFKNKFRWLTENSKGIINIYGIPHDNGFKRFRNDSLNQWKNDPSNLKYYNALLKDGLDRYDLNAKADFKLNDDWGASLQLNHVSDDYFLQDFSNFETDGMIEPDQLYNEGSLFYHGQYQQFSMGLSGFQTLHPYGLDADNQYDQFSTVDDLNFPVKRLDVHIQTDVTNFLMPNNLFSSPLKAIDKIVNGTRFHNRGTLLLPWMMSAGYVKAEIGWDALEDDLFYEKPATAPTGVMNGVMPKQVTRALPIVNLDSSVYLINRHIFNKKNWSSTIQPELSYLYIPYKNQQTLPVFDTTLLALSYDTLFSSNRFLGNDRIQNANQFNLGVKTTITNNTTGFQLLSIGTGMQYYMTLPKVQLAYQQPEPISQDQVSPWINEITLTPASALSTTVDWNWNWYKHATDSMTIEMSYQPSERIRLMASFDYLPPASPSANAVSTDLYTLGLATPLGHHLEAFSYQYYDAQADKMLASVGGFQYDSCCWALRAAISHQWDHQNPLPPNNQIYKNAIYVEFILKGLGNFGSSLESLLKSDFSGYNYR